ncbi:mechanosensitive ion channel family protein [bacterium]|nr:mechanosensitive ion channel family protein [bacterium]
MKKYLLLILFVACAELAFAAVPAKIAIIKPASDGKIDVTVAVTNAPVKTSADVKLKILDDINSQAQEAAGYLPAWTHSKILNVKIWQILAAFIFILLGLILRKINNYIFIHRKGFVIGKNAVTKQILDALSRPLGTLWAFSGLAVALTIIPIDEISRLKKLKSHFLLIGFAIIIIWSLFKIIDVMVAYLKVYTQKTKTTLDDQLLPLFRKTAKVLVFIIVFIWVAQALNYKVSTLIAGLGLGGFAIALGLQDTLANLFGSIFILFDRPFKVGDRIQVEGVDGIVEEIGMRSTKIRTLSKTLASIPNKTVASTKIDNFAEMTKRKVTQTIGVTYDTTADQMEQAVTEIKELILANDEIDDDFILVRFNDFGDSSLNISIIYFTKAVDYDGHLAVKEKVNLDIMRKLVDLGLSMAFPSRSVYIVNEK